MPERITWRIFPPPSIQDHEKLQKHSKRQPLYFEYQEGDAVVMMVPSTRAEGEGTARRLITGKVVRIEQRSEGETYDAKVVVAASGESRAEIVHSGTAPSNDDPKEFSFNEKDQRRFLQPSMAPRNPEDTTVILVQETAPFRQVVHCQLQKQDRVLEIGCSTGELSKKIWKTGVQTWLGIDVSLEILDKCRKQLDQFLESRDINKMDLRKLYTVLKIDPLLEPNRAFNHAVHLLDGLPTVICIDIGGNREHLPVMEVLSWVFQSFSGPSLRLVMIKSRAIVRAMLADDRVNIYSSTGVVSNGTAWFESSFRRLEQQACNLQPVKGSKTKFKHPIKAPLVLSPMDGVTPICRYHNYHPNGCVRQNECEFDHKFCHACLKHGHIALECPEDACY
jgi:SAM-dependent methyltransferase